MTTDELRQRFLNFFASKGHKIYPSDNLVPKDDPTLLFTSAGMNQFKQEFMGRPTRFRRRATCQKCLRTDDLDKVGNTSAHHTFFEMLGNFSFGAYFKEEAISWAWEFVTKELNLAQERLWISVYQQDNDAYTIWKDQLGLSEKQIVKLGAKENFWPANAPLDGPNGPCGPCSEIFYDQGERFGCGRPECNPRCSCGRFIETWNLVFTQFERKEKNRLIPLPNKNIDTGMGLERMAAVLQGVPNNFEIDIFRPITNEIMRLSCLDSANLSLVQYRARNTIADHIRAICFAIFDGVLPSNDERGYVIRKLIRRTLWHGRVLGIKKPYQYKIVPTVARIMEDAYPQLQKKREDIAQVILAEERRFYKTLKRAVAFAKNVLADLSAKGKSKVPGVLAFKLYDTYGLPRQMLETIMAEYNFELDQEGFEQQLELQRKMSKKTTAFASSVFVDTLVSRHKLTPTNFVGYDSFSVKTKVCALFKDGQSIKEARAGCGTIKIVLQDTPFYGESGGQGGDAGLIENRTAKAEVLDSKRIEQTIFHLGNVIKGIIKINDRVEAKIDLSRREDIARNHTATHLLQAALRQVLGEHVRQAGSWVGPDRLRFDFTHFQVLTNRQLQRVEGLVNDYIQKNRKLAVLKKSFEQAQKLGALAFFGEKYQERVRVVKVGDISLELCGGTHVTHTGKIKMFRIISESSVASGIRRIEALTANRATGLLKQEQDQLRELTQTFATNQQALPERIERLLGRIKLLKKKLDNSRISNFRTRMTEIVSDARKKADIKIIIQEIKSADIELLRLMADLLRQRASPCIVVLASVWEARVFIVCALTAHLSAQGLDAVKIIRALAKDVDGSGGGRVDFAQAGGRSPQGLKKGLLKAEEIINRELSNESN